MTAEYDHGVDVDELEAAIAARQRQIDRAETLEWCRARDEERRLDAGVITRSAPSREKQAMTDMSAEWRGYIAREIERANESLLKTSMSAVGEVLVEERKRVAEEHAKLRSEFELELTKLRAEMLQVQLDEARGTKRLKVVGTPLIG